MKEQLDYENWPVKKLFWNLFFPTLAGMLFNALFLITDGIFVGRGIGPNALAAINLFEPILVLYLAIGAMIGLGCSIKSAIHLSHKNIESAQTCISQAILIAFILTLAASALILIFPKAILTALGSTPNLYTMATDYLVWFIPSCIMLSIQIIGSYTIRLDGSPKYAMVASIIPNILNIILDYTFIIKMRMGLPGAALATDIGYIVGITMTIYYLSGKAKTLKLHFDHNILKPQGTIKLGVPAFINEISAGVSCLCGNIAFGKYLSDTGIAAYGVTCYLTPILFSSYIAISSAMQPIISYNHGAGRKSRVNETLSYGSKVTAIIAALTAAIVFCLPEYITSVFLKPGEAYHMAKYGLRLFAISYFFAGINVIMTTFFQSIENTMSSTLLTMFRGLILPIATFMMLPRIIGTSGLWLSVPTTEVIVFLIVIPLLIIEIRTHV